MIIRSAIAATVLLWHIAGAQTIFWSSPPDAVNLTSEDQPMDADFRFELGVFAGSFVPTSGNLSEWYANWRPIQRLSYNPVTQRFAGAHTPANNVSPFTIGKAVYVWGFKGDAVAAEWILFRRNTWVFPDANPLIPPPPNANEWFANASGVTAVVGSIQSAGSPFLMRSASVSGVVPPPTSWSQWREDMLAGEPLDLENQDPDLDGLANQLEFAYGTDPLEPNPAPEMDLTFETVDGQSYLQMSVPRRKDHVLSFTVQVSSDLSVWNEGPSFLQVIDDGALALVVRDLTPYPPEGGRRFMRLRALVASP